MKINFVLVLIFALATSAAFAKTNSYAPKAEDFRIVRGKLYNAILSTNWTTLGDSTFDYAESGKIGIGVTTIEIIRVETIQEDGIVCEIETKRFTSIGNRQQSGTSFTRVFIRNHPQQKRITTRDRIEKIRVMPTGRYQYGTETIKEFDYGLPNTPENQRLLRNEAN